MMVVVYFVSHNFQVVGSNTKADGHALAGGDMDEADNLMPPNQDDSNSENLDNDDKMEEESNMHDGGEGETQQQAEDDADTSADPKTKKQKSVAKAGEGESNDPAAVTDAGTDADAATDVNAGIIIGSNSIVEVDEDEFAAGSEDSAQVTTKNTTDCSRTEDDLLKEWQQLCMDSAVASRELCEALRLILEPTLASKMHGDFKTGKRINMRKVIPYIASSFRRDRIWLRRTAPQKRAYQIVVCMDNSSSMRGSGAVQPALNSLAMIWNALQQLEVGQVGVFSFDAQPKLLHSLEDALTESAGARLLQSLSFDASAPVVNEGGKARGINNSDFAQLLDSALSYLDDSKAASSSSSSSELQQVCLFIYLHW
jgi:midasin